MSTKSSFAASRPVNPPGATPVLTEEQVWKGLSIKARKPQSFVSAITSCEVTSDSGNKLVRSVRFNNADPVNEEIDLHEATIAYFEVPSSGGRVTNVLSYDENDEMILTYTFANGIPGVQPGQSSKEINHKLGGVVAHGVERIRELVRDGTIQ